MDLRALIVFLSLWSSGFWAEDTQRAKELPGDVRLVGGASRCAGKIEMKLQGEWKSPYRPKTKTEGLRVDQIEVDRFGKTVDELPSSKVEITCSDSVRLVNGTSLCSGRLEVKPNHSNQSWSPVCEADFDQQDAEVVCRELGCGPPSFLQGALYGEVEAPMWTKEFQCGGHESALLDCRSSEPGGVRLNGGANRCAGVLEMKWLDEWKPVAADSWNLLKLADSVRLVDGTSLCSGRLEVKSDESNQSWSPVCEADFGQQDAEVVCRELGCGPPSFFQGALYGEVEAPMWTKEFQCGGHESAFLDCRSSGSERNTCSPGKAVGLTCSDPPGDIRLVGEASRCAGILEVKNQREWRSVFEIDHGWNHTSSAGAAVCRQLDCGSFLSTYESDNKDLVSTVWWINSSCVDSRSTLKECTTTRGNSCSSAGLKIICTDLLAEPNISSCPSPDGVSDVKQQGVQVLMGSNFTLRCSVEPQFPGGYFQLISTSSNRAQNYTLPAVNHSAHFLFFAADHTHRGEYRCVYHNYVFYHNFSSESQPLHVTLAGIIPPLVTSAGTRKYRVACCELSRWLLSVAGVFSPPGS
ncbi:scavenger receptor cysteine-rich type 1 protein M130-like [Epinephelus moara]|uniref:scavenger receptor cysteine-rich type 1 protein M130-like n=1 Tax=Epinephelus moara TaxID=300413 RepID=UPI00214F2AD4|nr:scavenger receptor cysteine-rich type 1 protein M130-like [Epinephelus moara]